MGKYRDFFDELEVIINDEIDPNFFMDRVLELYKNFDGEPLETPQYDWEVKRQQEKEELIAMGLCTFDMAWHGFCKGKGNPCKEHIDVMCDVCKKQATHNCSFAGQFVCGRPLCDDCQCPERHR